MEKGLLFLFSCLVMGPIFSQTWIAGDTANYEVSMVNQSFAPNATVYFDIDCDGSADFYLQSTGPSGVGSPWERLSFYMEDNVEVYNSNTGLITPFEAADTVALGVASMWTEHLDFIYGTGALGAYGQYSITNKYLVFRKNDSAVTHYTFILFSNIGINFSIHQVISNCTTNPIEITSGVVNSQPEKIACFPNPSQGLLNLSKQVEELLLYKLDGSLVFRGRNVHQNIDLNHLGKGVYLVQIIDQGHREMIKVLID